MLLCSFQSLQKFSCSWKTSVPFWRGRFPCNVAAHCVADWVLIRLKACIFSRVLSESPLQGLQPWQFPQNMGSKEKALLTTPLYGELHLHTFPRICWRSSERHKVRVVIDRPRLCRASSVDANVDGLKNSNTHQRIAKAIFFSFDAPSSRTLKLPFTIFVVHAPPESGSPLILVGFWVFNRRVMHCNQRRVWPGVGGGGGGQLGRFRRKFFFFLYFRKKLRTRATRNKENNNSGLTGKSMCPCGDCFASYLYVL